MSKTNLIDLHIFPDEFFEDGDEYPSEEQMLQDIEAALIEFAEFERGEITLRVTERFDRDAEETTTVKRIFFAQTAIRLAMTIPVDVSETTFKMKGMASLPADRGCARLQYANG